MYFDELKEIIDKRVEFIDGVSLKNQFKEKFGGGSDINMNKALKKLREKNLVTFRKDGRKIFYKRLDIK